MGHLPSRAVAHCFGAKRSNLQPWPPAPGLPTLSCQPWPPAPGHKASRWATILCAGPRAMRAPERKTSRFDTILCAHLGAKQGSGHKASRFATILCADPMAIRTPEHKTSRFETILCAPAGQRLAPERKASRWATILCAGPRAMRAPSHKASRYVEMLCVSEINSPHLSFRLARKRASNKPVPCTQRQPLVPSFHHNEASNTPPPTYAHDR